MSVQTYFGSDKNTAQTKSCTGPTFFAPKDVLDPNSPNYGDYQLQCTQYTNITTLCDSSPVCD